ncbi:MAG: hypothetical protein HY042_10115, partial [Spirochaetia bacterium]|nr:hypothetical protein [Spirochaetia bacterium]
MAEGNILTDESTGPGGGSAVPVVDAARGWAVLTVTGMAAEQVTLDLGLHPDRVVSDDVGGTFWQLRSQLTGNHTISDHLNDLVARL